MPPAPTVVEFFSGLEAYATLKAKANPEAQIFEEESTELVDKTGTVRVRSCGLKAVNDFRKALERGGETWVGWQLDNFLVAFSKFTMEPSAMVDTAPEKEKVLKKGPEKCEWSLCLCCVLQCPLSNGIR